MSYARYLLKLSFKNKLNFFPIILPIGIIIFLAMMNTSAKENTSYINSVGKEIHIMNTLHSDYQSILEEETLSEEDIEGMTLAISNLENNLALSQQSVDYAVNGNWSESLNIQLDLLEKNALANIENGTSLTEESYVRSMYNRKASYDILAEHNLEPEFSGIETKGFTFTYRMMDILFPAIFTICLITLLSNIFGGNLMDRLDIEDMFPVNQLKWQLKKITLVYLISLLLCFMWYGLSLTISTLLNGSGSLHYPVNIYTDTFLETLPVSTLMGNGILLQSLAILFVVTTVYLISLLVKNQLTTLFVSAIILIGPILLTGNVAPLGIILHLLPTTYFNAIRVLTNQLAVENNNVNIKFGTGIYVLLLSVLLMVAIILCIKKHHEKNQLFNKNR